jgi:hypothetical protein
MVPPSGYYFQTNKLPKFVSFFSAGIALGCAIPAGKKAFLNIFDMAMNVTSALPDDLQPKLDLSGRNRSGINLACTTERGSILVEDRVVIER